jgi:hypothetical protein
MQHQVSQQAPRGPTSEREIVQSGKGALHGIAAEYAESDESRSFQDGNAEVAPTDGVIRFTGSDEPVEQVRREPNADDTDQKTEGDLQDTDYER